LYSSSAQDNGSINGTITDMNGMPLIGTTIQIISLKTTVSDANGKFVFDKVLQATIK
jgi:protocatechuate 3,4-dioxygenase beta subunit